MGFVGSVVSEPIVSDIAIGALMLRAQAQFRCRFVFAGMVVLAIQGIAMNAVMAMLEKCMTGSANRPGLAAR